MADKRNTTIEVDYLARVEGEGNMFIEIKDGELQELRFGIHEPPRFFEAFLKDRKFTEAPDITARICGICPVAYQMSSVHAMEDALQAQITPWIREMRRFFYCGEHIQSHILHAYLLHAPDFLGYESSIHMAADFPKEVEHGLQLKKVGNEIMEIIGGRAVHPINIRVGGFYKAPTRKQMRDIIPVLEKAREMARESCKWVATLPFPDFDRDYTYVCVHHPDEYAFSEGNIVSNKGLNIPASAFNDTFEEIHVEHSNALHCRFRDGGGCYHMGPLARIVNNFDQLPDDSKALADEIGLTRNVMNPFKSILARALETYYCTGEALRIAKEYELPEQPYIDLDVKAGIGHAMTEAPRGGLYHRYRIDDEGLIKEAQLTIPTSQNQAMIEDDLRDFVPKFMHLSDDKLQWHCEQAIRNYDPCISCATHFLNLTVKRS
ncbi:MAG: Ni/Fe hydrogenase subunit alpha [Alphaproteobacteria bacterium]|nr:Ni/Fe hydrogenase subunit alpha [Alphaproteobacteria bacterium]